MINKNSNIQGSIKQYMKADYEYEVKLYILEWFWL